MQRKKSYGEYRNMIVLGAVLIGIGIFLGALTVCYVPKNLIEETQSGFVIEQSGIKELPKMFRTDFIIEFLWIFLIWLLTMGNLTRMFSVLLIILRGAIVGFCVEFALGTENAKEIFLTGILPQCVVGIPIMTIFFAMCIKYAKEKRESRNEYGYFILGGTFTLITLLTALAESVLVTVFINIL